MHPDEETQYYSEDEPINPEIERRFTYHPPKEDQPIRYNRVRENAKFLAYVIDQCCPDSREKSRALNHLDEAVMLANAAIARNE